jgi:hypothetical protein
MADRFQYPVFTIRQRLLNPNFSRKIRGTGVQIHHQPKQLISCLDLDGTMSGLVIDDH